MNKKVRMYIIRATSNSSERTSLGSRYYTKISAKRELNKLLSKPKKNKYGIYMTSYRDAQSGGGINNPRIKKIMGFK